jgi:hypothetical protein
MFLLDMPARSCRKGSLWGRARRWMPLLLFLCDIDGGEVSVMWYVHVTWSANNNSRGRDDVKERLTRATGGRGVQTGRDQGKPNRTIVCWLQSHVPAGSSHKHNQTTLPPPRDEPTNTHSQYRTQLSRHPLSGFSRTNPFPKPPIDAGLFRLQRSTV